MWLLLLAYVATFGSAASAALPNVVVIFVDDMGYGDLGCYGAKGWSTPHLDKLAAEGTRFSSFYVSQPVCSASRASLLTGCYANRVGISGALSPASKIGLHENELTLAKMFKSKGYATGMAGKWHLGHQPLFLPTKRGFDTWLGLPYSNDMWPGHPTAKAGTYPPLPLFNDNEVISKDVNAAEQATLTRRYTEHAVEFIEKNKAKPFFYYLAYSMPHVPLFTAKEFEGVSKSGRYGDVVQEIDHNVGVLLKALKDRGLDSNTIVLFTSDNGPWLPYGTHAGTTGGLREGKGTVWEGGVRVPCVLKWPGSVPAGKTCDVPWMTIDVLPTLARVIGADLPKHRIDGVDLSDFWKTGKYQFTRTFAFYYKQGELQAVREGDWKLVLPHTYPSLDGKPGGTDGKPVTMVQKAVREPELYNMKRDAEEEVDVAAGNPHRVKRLLQQVEQFREDLGDTAVKRIGKGVRPAGKAE